VTGVSGFIGGAVAARLQAAGWRVRGLVRPAGRPARTAAGSLQLVRGSLENFFSLVELVQGADAVVHCAGAVRGATREDFDLVNVAGLERLLRAVRASSPPPRRFIHFSSLAARQPHLSPYAASKKKGEVLLASQTAGLAWVVLRPPAVYGPGDREMLPLFRMMARGVALVPGDGRGRFSLLHVDDLATAVEKLLAAGVDGQVFELHDGKPAGYDWAEVMELVAARRQKPLRRLAVPLPLLLPVAWLNRQAGMLTGRKPMLTPGKVRELAHPDWVCDNEKISRQTGWQPAITLEDGLATLLNW